MAQTSEDIPQRFNNTLRQACGYLAAQAQARLQIPIMPSACFGSF
jgi:hypothetical protein